MTLEPALPSSLDGNLHDPPPSSTALWSAALFSWLGSRRPTPRGAVRPNIHKIATVDSVGTFHIETSPDRRWLALDKDGTIWTMTADGRAKPVRLLTPGRADEFPTWFRRAAGFLSHRTDGADGSTGLYAMTVEIDPATGQAKGTPRQVSTEPVQAVGDASPDGKWLSYLVVGEKGIKVVPTKGGTARTVVMMDESTCRLVGRATDRRSSFQLVITTAPGTAFLQGLGQRRRGDTRVQGLNSKAIRSLHRSPRHRQRTRGQITRLALFDERDRQSELPIFNRG